MFFFFFFGPQVTHWYFIFSPSYNYLTAFLFLLFHLQTLFYVHINFIIHNMIAFFPRISTATNILLSNVMCQDSRFELMYNMCRVVIRLKGKNKTVFTNLW